MPRFYNFASIAAWTAGSLAANRAYYESKTPFPLHGRRVWHPTRTAEALKRLDGIPAESHRISEEVMKAIKRGAKKKAYDLVPFLKMRGYSDWLLAHKSALKKFFRDAYRGDITDNPAWHQPSALSEVLANIDRVVGGFEEFSDNMLHALLEPITKESDRESLRELLVKGLGDVHVSPNEWTVSYSGTGLVLNVTSPQSR